MPDFFGQDFKKLLNLKSHIIVDLHFLILLINAYFLCKFIATSQMELFVQAKRKYVSFVDILSISVHVEEVVTITKTPVICMLEIVKKMHFRLFQTLQNVVLGKTFWILLKSPLCVVTKMSEWLRKSSFKEKSLQSTETDLQLRFLWIQPNSLYLSTSSPLLLICFQKLKPRFS